MSEAFPPSTSAAQTPPIGTAALPFLGDPPISAQQLGPNWYLEGFNDVDYEIDTGIRQLHVAGPVGTPTQLVRVHSGAAFRVVLYTAVRVGAKPDIPAPQGNVNEVLAYARIRALTPSMTSNGVRIYRTSVKYVFLQVATPVIGVDNFSAGAVPWDQQPSALNNVVPSSFQIPLADSSSCVPQGANAAQPQNVFGGIKG